MNRTANAAMGKNTGLQAIAGRNARVLILGSFPGKISLARKEYYANPRNAFWRILHAVAGVGVDQAYEVRVKKVCAAGFALWDVCAVVSRHGSLDSTIRSASVVPNDFTNFFRSHVHIRRICFNGQTAARLYRRHVLPTIQTGYRELPLVVLPSSSPAYAAMSVAEKAGRWRSAFYTTNG